MRVKALAQKEIFKNGDFRIVSFSPIGNFEELKLSKYFNFTVKGSNFPYITIGKEYELEINELATDKYGTSYEILDCPSLSKLDFHDLSREESLDILLDCTSSERIANNILDSYPNYIELVLDKGEKAIDTSLIKGVGEAYNKAYCRELLSKYKYYSLMKRYKTYMLDTSDCKALYDIYLDDNGIDKEMNEHPYKCLINDLERTFTNTDKLILAEHEEFINSTERCEFCILDILKRNEYDGSTRLNGNVMYKVMKEEYNVPELLPLVVGVCKNSDLIYYDDNSKDLSIMSTYLGECNIRSFVYDKLNNSTKLDIDWTKYTNVDGFELTEEQSLALKNFCESNISILCGVSGGGKTSSVKALVKLMEENGLTYSLLSPTGSASLRLSNQTNRKASTIHRKVLKDGEIDSDVIIIDEMSMVGLDVLCMLLGAISNENCRVVFCGDDSQLPSISVGTIFSDMIESNIIPKVKLTKVFRYDTNGGSFVGENIRQGKKFLDNEVVKEKDNIYTIFGNYKFMQSNDDEIFDKVIEEYKELTKKYKLEDIIILSPFNVGSCGTFKLNRAIEDEYNAPKPNELTMSYKKGKETILFRVGSRVVNTKNDYHALTLEAYEMIEGSDGLLTEDDVETTELFNGEIGTVRSIDEKKMVCQFDEQLIVFTKGNISNLLLARAISVHRSQGGEWKAVINVISPAHEKMLSKNLLYVSDTRGKEFHCDIGNRNTFENALLVDSVQERNTWLKELLLNKED